MPKRKPQADTQNSTSISTHIQENLNSQTNSKNKNNSAHKKHRERMRARFLNSGLENFEPHEILELMLFYSIPLKNTNDIGHRLINRFGSFAGVLNAKMELLSEVEGVGPNSALMINLFREVSRIYNTPGANQIVILDNVHKIMEYVNNVFIGRYYETLFLICLNSAYKLLKLVKINEGTIDHVTVNQRKLVHEALKYDAEYVILAHNHSAEVLVPSGNDINATYSIKDALSHVDIKIIDHFIVAPNGTISMVQSNVCRDCFFR